MEPLQIEPPRKAARPEMAPGRTWVTRNGIKVDRIAMPNGTMDWVTVVLGLAAFAVLTFWKWRLNVVVVVLSGGALGLLRVFAPMLFGKTL